VHEVEDAGRDLRFRHHFREESRRRRCFLRGFRHHRVPAGESGSDFPRQKEKREVPRSDDADHTLRLPDGVVQGRPAVGGVGAEGLNAFGPDEIGEDAEVRGGPRDVDARGERNGLSGVGDLPIQELVEPGLDPIGDANERGRAIPDGELAPGSFEGAPSGFDRFVDGRAVASATSVTREPFAGGLSRRGARPRRTGRSRSSGGACDAGLEQRAD
jgi:hypothetical protein